VPVKSYTDVTVSDLDTGGYQATLPNGIRYIFNIAGMLQSIGDLNGNTIQLAYTDTTYPYYVTQVTDTAGRMLLFFFIPEGSSPGSPARSPRWIFSTTPPATWRHYRQEWRIQAFHLQRQHQ